MAVERLIAPMAQVPHGLAAHRLPHDGPPSATAARLLELGARDRAAAATEAQAQACLRSLQQAAATLPQTTTQALGELASLVVELGLGLAEEVVGAAVDEHQAEAAAAAVRHCLADAVVAPAAATVTLRLHPEDLALVLDTVTADAAAMGLAVECVPDPSVPVGSARSETDAGSLRYEPQEVLARMATAVRSAARAVPEPDDAV